MKEITGELWDFYARYDYDTGTEYVVCITTNGFVKANGDAVMGRGCAREATQRIEGCAKLLGSYIKKLGNVPGLMRTSADETEGLFIFPVKHNWWEQADLDLIRKSAQALKEYARGTHDRCKWILPRPGCGNGRLTYEQVKPLLEDLPDNVWVISKEAA